MFIATRIICRIACAVAVLLPIMSAGGCAAWKSDRWNIDSLRDDRAVDLEQRLSHDRTIVDNPFR